MPWIGPDEPETPSSKCPASVDVDPSWMLSGKTKMLSGGLLEAPPPPPPETIFSEDYALQGDWVAAPFGTNSLHPAPPSLPPS